MPDQLTSLGLQVKSVTDLIADLVAAFRAIYGNEISVDTDTPDGQLINILAQAGADVRDVLTQIYNSISVDTATGVALDLRVALNGIARKKGTFTLTPVDVTVSAALSLVGLDAAANDVDVLDGVYTATDDAGNQFVLVTSNAFAGAGTQTLTFRAKTIGAIPTIKNTITKPVTIVDGVTSLNNPDAATQIGVEEETDSDLRLRHAKALTLGANSPADSVLAALLALPDVTDALVKENTTAADADGVPAHGLWCIVENGADADVAAAIAEKKSSGAALAGGVTVTVPLLQGNSINIKFDRPIEQPLAAKFAMVPIIPQAFDFAAVADKLAQALSIFKLGQHPNIGDVVVAMKTIEPNAYLTDLFVSDDGGTTWESAVTPVDFQHKFTLIAGDIAIS